MRSLSLLAFVLLVLPVPAQAALTPVGAPFAVVDESPCSFLKDLEVIASPEGAFEVVWVDDFELEVRSRLFEPNLDPSGPPLALLPLHGGLNAFDFAGSWAGDFEVVMNVVDTGSNSGAPLAAYRVQLDENGNPLAPPVRVKTKNFVKLAPAAGGDSLQFRAAPPFVGGPSCRSVGLLARRIDADGTPLSPESLVTRRAPAWTGSHLVVERLPNDTFVAAYAYRTCQNFTGLAARRLDANGVPLGKAINLPMPGRVGNVAGGDVVLAAQGRNFAAAAMISHPSIGPEEGYAGFTTAVLNDKVFGPHRISSFPVSGVVDMAASPAGGYLLLFMGSTDDSPYQALFVQELDARGVPQGQPLALTGADYIGFDGAVASLPDGRWIVVTRAQQVDSGACSERLVGTVVAGD